MSVFIYPLSIFNLDFLFQGTRTMELKGSAGKAVSGSVAYRYKKVKGCALRVRGWILIIFFAVVSTFRHNIKGLEAT